MKSKFAGRKILLFLVILFLTQCATQKPKVIVPVKEQRESRELQSIPREFRAAWIASVANINWPSKPGLTSAQQKAEAIALLDLLQELNFNAAILQIRPQCDALYQSDLEPWSYYLTGTQGQAPEPYYDPLQFWVEQAHKRAIELHAWLNPYRAHHVSGGPVSEYSVVNRHPELVVKLKTGYYWLDPANPETQEHSYNVVMDIVKRYDIDGIHFDDYFYPYPSYNNDEDFPDDASWQLYLDNGGTLSRGDWRRDAVNRFIERLYKGIHREKSHVKFGLSPFGIWRPGHPPSIEGFDQFEKLYADAKLWLNKGWIDYFTPQLYWTVNKIPQSFPVLLGWWQKENKKQRHLWPGMSIGRLKGEKAADETINQIMITRGMLPQSPGAVHWSITPLQTNKQLVKALLKGPYRRQALIPSSPWINNDMVPAAPAVTLQKSSESLSIKVQQPVRVEDNQTIVYSKYGDFWQYRIFGRQSEPSSLPLLQLNNRVSLKNFAEKEGLQEMCLALNKIAVSFIGRNGNESEPFIMDISADSNSKIPFTLKKQMADRLFKEYNQDSLPGAAVMVIKDGKIIFKKGYGFANLETKDSVSSQSNFRLASVTKAFTAMAILQLIEKGKLSLDTKLTEVFNDFPSYGRAVRIQDLLRHTSGLQDYEKLIPDSQPDQVKDRDVLTLLKTVDNLYFTPAGKYQYSNSAYALLSLIIEKISGKPFRDYLRENIFEPSAMNSTLAFEKSINKVPERAFGYSISKDKPVELSDQSQTSAVLGDGGIYSSLDDMYKWDQILYTDKLLSKKLMKQALARQHLKDGTLIDYGFGWHLENYRDMDIKYHTGSTRGFRNIFYRIPEKQFSIVVLTNRNGFGTLNTMQLAHRLTDLFLFE